MSSVLEHFGTVAGRYRALRVTDIGPIDVITSRLDRARPLIGAEIGAGTGRYTELLHERLAPGSLTLAYDYSHDMLRAKHPVAGIQRVQGRAEALAVAPRRLDWISTFNAIHHFGFADFIKQCAQALVAGGWLFIYTRTPEQNARSIWGRHFPHFTRHERRLLTPDLLRKSIDATPELALVDWREFRYGRTASHEQLRARVKGHHYSTFSLYEPAQLHKALNKFLERLPAGPTHWEDQNLLLACRHTPE